MDDNEYKRILVPVDGSKESEDAALKAAAIAARNGGLLDILNVISSSTLEFGYGTTTGSAINEIISKQLDYLKRLQKRIEDQVGFKNVTIHARFGSPRNVISFEFPEDHHNDLIVMGATGKHRIKNLLEGSVTNYVNENAHCDVIVVRTDMKNKLIK